MAEIALEVVSAEKEIYSGDVAHIRVTGEMGELGIEPGHSPLLTLLHPGNVFAKLPNGEEQVFYISGGILEVQPYRATVLSDTAIRAEDIDEAAAEEAKRKAEQVLAQRGADFEYSQAAIELAQAVAQIRAIRKLKERLK